MNHSLPLTEAMLCGTVVMVVDVTIICDVLAKIERRVQSTYRFLHLKNDEHSVVCRNPE